MRVDSLLGLKENVIIGKLIPAGTGMNRYRQLKILSEDIAQEETEETDVSVDMATGK